VVGGVQYPHPLDTITISNEKGICAARIEAWAGMDPMTFSAACCISLGAATWDSIPLAQHPTGVGVVNSGPGGLKPGLVSLAFPQVSLEGHAEEKACIVEVQAHYDISGDQLSPAHQGFGFLRGGRGSSHAAVESGYLGKDVWSDSCSPKLDIANAEWSAQRSQWDRRRHHG
jgi:hypothetical protein